MRVVWLALGVESTSWIRGISERVTVDVIESHLRRRSSPLQDFLIHVLYYLLGCRVNAIT